jgi:hypothetical protein
VVALNNLPSILSSIAGSSEKEKWQIFADAMDKAGLERYPFNPDRHCIDRTKLEMYLKGDDPSGNFIYKPPRAS